jgi:uncharacterized protein YqhQ
MKSPASIAKFTSIGGQAIIEGVMMRSPHFIAIAVRKPDQKIVIRNLKYKSITQRIPLLKKPMLRGIVTIVEAMLQGIEALSFSAQVAAEEDKETDGELSNWAIISSIAFAFALGMGLFVALPHFLTVLMTSNSFLSLTAESPIFHLLDGLLKMLILISYVYLIALMKDIHRVFQYHGAEHKSIYAFEAGEELTVANARKHTTLHPRCGTSFLLFLVLISIIVFSVIFPTFGLTNLSSNSVMNHVLMVVLKILLMFPVAGLAYEFIKMCACRMNNPLFRAMIWPGMILQRLTTREPSDDQLEVALASLKQVLRLEKTPEDAEERNDESEITIGQLSELGRIQASVAEFPEA